MAYATASSGEAAIVRKSQETPFFTSNFNTVARVEPAGYPTQKHTLTTLTSNKQLQRAHVPLSSLLIFGFCCYHRGSPRIRCKRRRWPGDYPLKTLHVLHTTAKGFHRNHLSTAKRSLPIWGNFYQVELSNLGNISNQKNPCTSPKGLPCPSLSFCSCCTLDQSASKRRFSGTQIA